MAFGFLTPDARLRVLSDLGVVLPGALLNAYVAGSLAARQNTYSDSALTVPNANPVVASSGGLFGPIYLSAGLSYQFQLTTSAGVVVWTQDNIAIPGSSVALGGTGAVTLTAHGVLIGEGTSAIAATSAGTAGQVLTSNGAALDPTFQASAIVNDFRLTLTTGLPVTVADVTAATSVFWTPKTGNRCTIFTAAGAPTTLTSVELSIALPAVASQMYDVFVFSNAGVLTLELLAWTNDTTRATAIVLTTTGTYCKSGDLTRRFVGSVRTTTVAGQTEDSAVKRYLSNAYGRVGRALVRQEPAATWTYTLATIRQANANVLNQVDVVACLPELLLALDLVVALANTNAPVAAAVMIGEDSLIAPVAGQAQGYAQTAVANTLLSLHATLRKTPAVGRHVYSWLEASVATGTATWTGFGGGFGSGNVAGLYGSIEG